MGDIGALGHFGHFLAPLLHLAAPYYTKGEEAEGHCTPDQELVLRPRLEEASIYTQQDNRNELQEHCDYPAELVPCSTPPLGTVLHQAVGLVLFFIEVDVPVQFMVAFTNTAWAPLQTVQDGLGTKHSTKCQDSHDGMEAWQHVEDDSGHGHNLKHRGYCTLQTKRGVCGGGGGGGGGKLPDGKWKGGY